MTTRSVWLGSDPEDTPTREKELFARAWPAGPAKADVALYRTMSEDQRSAVLRRLEAMLDAEEGTTSRTALAERIGVDRSYFFKLHRRWKADRRLSTLVPYQGRPARRTDRNRLNELMEVTVRRLLLRSPPGVRNVDVAREAATWEKRRQSRLVRMKGGEPTAGQDVELDRSRIGAALSIASYVRRELATNATWLEHHYGDALVLDVTAISLALADPSDVHRQAIVALVIEGASGLVLGHAIGTLDHASDLPFAAISMAENRLQSEWLDVCDPGAGATSLSAIVVDDPTSRPADVRTARGSPSTADVTRVSDHIELWRGTVRRFGMLTLERVGFKIGRMNIHPRATYTGDAKVDLANRRYVVADMDEAVRIWTYEVERHNHPIEERLRGFDRLCVHGRMTAALGELRAALQDAVRPTMEDRASASAPD